MVAQAAVLVASADLQTCRTLASILSQWGLAPIFCSTVSAAEAILAREAVPLVFCENRLADGSFHDLLRVTNFAKLRARVAVILRRTDENASVESAELDPLNAVACPYRLASVRRVIFDAMRAAQVANWLEWEVT